MSEVTIHPTAIVSPEATIGKGTEIGAYSIIGPKVKIGENNTIKSHVVIEGLTTIGANNTIFQFASIGAIPQDLKYKGEPSTLSIGNNNIIREYVTLQPGTQGGGMRTTIADSNLFMATTHVGHDCHIDSKNVFANGATVAGHVIIGSNIIVGGLVGIHQFVKVGSYSMIAAGSMVNKDIPPYTISQGDRAALVGINQIGLERNGFTEEEVQAIKNAYKSLFISKNGTFEQRLDDYSKQLDIDVITNSPALQSKLDLLLNFIRESERGITPTRRK